MADNMLIGASVDYQLDKTLWKLIRGEVEIYDLTPALAAWWSLAHEYGRRSRQSEIDRLNAENDRLYLHAFNKPADVEKILARRVDEGLAEYEREFFANGGEVQ